MEDSYVIGKRVAAMANFGDVALFVSPAKVDWPFLRGIFEEAGGISPDAERPVAHMSLPCEALLTSIQECAGIPCKRHGHVIEFHETNCIDLLGRIYSQVYNSTSQQYQEYVRLLTGKEDAVRIPECRVFRTRADAILPAKAKPSDAGYDLTIVGVHSRPTPNVTLYDTGLRIRPDHGLYAEVVPRSSLSKSGHMLANSVGIIDRSYTNNVLVALVKVDPAAPDITLPMRCCQIIFRRQEHVRIQDVDDMFEATERGGGGFGSTG